MKPFQDSIIVVTDFVLSEIQRRAYGKDGSPLGESPLQKKNVMTAKTCAARIVRAMENRDRLAVLSLRGKAGRWIKMIAPGLLDQVAAKAIQEGK